MGGTFILAGISREAHPRQRPVAKKHPRRLAAAASSGKAAEDWQPPWCNPWVFGLLVVVATVLAYQPVWQGGFIWDDDLYVTGNPLLSAPDGWRRIWFSADAPSQYFPLTYSVFRLEWMLWGLNATGYHWVNILLHATNAVLVWRVLAGLGVPGARLACLFFALHPVQVESVAWITELKNILSLFFCLLAALAWVRVVEERPGFWRYFAGALAAYTLALLAKSTACTLPAALLLMFWFAGKKLNFKRLALVGPFILLGVGMGLLAMWWERYHQGTQGRGFALTPLERLLVAAHALWFYLGKLGWPAGLAFSYPRWTIRTTDVAGYLWLLPSALVLLARGPIRRRFGRGPETGLLFFVATLAPLLGFIMLYTFRYTFVADHYQYAASIGLLALAAAGIIRVSRRLPPRARLLPAMALLIGLGVLTFRQSSAYTDAQTLWSRTLQANPNSTLACNNLGNLLLDQNQVDAAMALFNRAVAVDPGLAETHSNLGNAFAQKHQAAAAQAEYERALQLEPGLPEVHNNLGSLLAATGRRDAAKLEYEKALALRPAFAGAQNNLGMLLLGQGALEEALPHLRRAVELRPDFAAAHNSLGAAFFEKGDLAQAIPEFQKALALNPDLATAHNNLGGALLQQGRLPEAVAHFTRALELQPGFAEAENNLGKALLGQASPKEAIPHFQRALELRPDFRVARQNLQRALELERTGPQPP